MTTKRAPRADRLRNRDAILDAAELCLTEDAHASMLDIAQAAGVGRVTIYGHFATREELIETALVRTIERSEAELATIALDGDAMEALKRLVHKSWRIVDRFHRMLAAVEATLTNDEIVAHHSEPMARVRELIERGQAGGVMRDDLDAGWLTTCFTAVLHTAASELRAGRLAEKDADRMVAATVTALVRVSESSSSCRSHR